MSLKYCIKCCEKKNLKEFYNQPDRKKGSSFCKKCFNQYQMNKWKERKIKFIMQMGGGCNHCLLKLKDSHYAVFDFHHKDPSIKKFPWPKLRMRKESDIIKELASCEVLCANCHRIIHTKDNDH